MNAADTAHAIGVDFVSFEDASRSELDFGVLSQQEALQRFVLPLRWPSGGTVFAISDASDDALIAWLSARAGPSMRWALTEQQTILSVLEGTGSQRSTTHGSGARVTQSAVVDFVDRAVESAWRAGASDVHFETRRDGLVVKFRVDGVLEDAMRWRGQEDPAEVLSRIKVLADLDISERRVPQDGRFTRHLGARPVDLRVSIMPNPVGEDAVLRLLDKQHLIGGQGQMKLAGLGFTGTNLTQIGALAKRAHGMLLVTGPTGSGKTTTVYAALSEIMSTEQKIITIEDPIEYELQGVLQIPVNDAKGLSFARGLRSILRHDPDTIFVGEIRDAETADIAVQAALTGHLVFTTVHANNVFDVLGRFLHMDVDLFSLMSALNGVISQRLVRLSCTACGGPGLNRAGTVGCEECRFTGYSGRTVIGEVLVIDDRFRELVVARAAVGELKMHARSLTKTTLRDEASTLINTRRTTWAEVERVVTFD